MPFGHNMSYRPYHNLKQMSHWMRQIFVTVIQLDIVVIESREKTDISEYTLKPNFLRCHQKTCSPHVPCTKHKKFDSISGQCPRYSHIVARVVLACHSITGWTISTPHFTFGKSWLKKWFHDIGAAIAAWICLTVMQMSFSRSLFTAKGNLPCFV